MAKRSYRRLLFALALVAFVADQGSKYGMFNWLYGHGPAARFYDGDEVNESYEHVLIPEWFSFHARYVKDGPACDCPLVKASGPLPPAVNHGALWSLGGEFKTNANKFFAVVSLLAAVGISVWAVLTRPTSRWLCVALGLILGGTVGNLFDRIVFGGVRDFLRFHPFNFPIFNVADSCLVVGASMLLLQALFGKRKAETPPATPSEPAPQPPVA
jgi:lipoprotein signal peptidase